MAPKRAYSPANAVGTHRRFSDMGCHFGPRTKIKIQSLALGWWPCPPLPKTSPRFPIFEATGHSERPDTSRVRDHLHGVGGGRKAVVGGKSEHFTAWAVGGRSEDHEVVVAPSVSLAGEPPTETVPAPIAMLIPALS